MSRWVKFMIFSVFFSGILFPGLLRASITVKNLSFDAETEKVVWKEENGKLMIVATGPLKLGEVLPDTCRICVSSGVAILEQRKKEVKVASGEYYDPSAQATKPDFKTHVKVAEGRVVYQDELEENGVRKPLGDPIAIDKGFVLVKLSNCFTFKLLTIENFEGGETAIPAASPTEEFTDEGPSPPPQQPCASPPCS